MAALQEAIGAVRNLRAEYGIQPGAKIPLRVNGEPEWLREVLDGSRRSLADLARVEELSFGGAAGEIGATAVLAGGVELFVPLAGVIDLEKERARLREELTRLSGQVKATEAKLSNESFTSRAPADVVGRERDKLVNFREQAEALSAKLASLEGAA
jgi:valyl-tRNA synthetase